MTHRTEPDLHLLLRGWGHIDLLLALKLAMCSGLPTLSPLVTYRGFLVLQTSDLNYTLVNTLLQWSLPANLSVRYTKASSALAFSSLLSSHFS